MARRIDGSSSMAALFGNEGICTDGIEALLAPGSFAGRFLDYDQCGGLQFMMNSDGTHGSSLKFDLEETGDDDFEECPQQPGKKRRLTIDQVQFLEKSFELENKLEPERKFQIAKDLGLKPRQVAIWFQNRRARWKTKQLEKEFESLKSSNDSLKVDYDNLLKENEKLQAEVASLTSKLLSKENGNGGLESFKLDSYPDRFQSIGTATLTRLRRLDAQAMPCKQEDLSSMNSAVLDSESPHCIDDGGYCKVMEPTSPANAFEHDRPDRKQDGEIDEALGCGLFLRPEQQQHYCRNNYEFQVEDQAFWFWP